MWFVLIKGFLGSILLVAVYSFIGQLLNFPLFYLWFKRRSIIINNLSYFFFLFYSLLIFYLIAVYLCSVSIVLGLYLKSYYAIAISLFIGLLVSGHLFNQNKIAIMNARNADSLPRLTFFDNFEFKSKQYLVVLTKYGYIIWIIYIFLQIFSDNLDSLSFGLSTMVIDNILK